MMISMTVQILPTGYSWVDKYVQNDSAALVGGGESTGSFNNSKPTCN
jgi:hypothetical protein